MTSGLLLDAACQDPDTFLGRFRFFFFSVCLLLLRNF
uniref:Uncharacterized protein n=1 Tax=Anguilla anguilla TaxID=7936 RepID=A0A0E9WCY1_ANGAN